jgi:hypothetical protein
MRLTAMVHDNAIAAFLEYQRSRLRVARATVVNLLAMIPTGAIYRDNETDVGTGGIAWYVGVTSGAFVLSIYAAARIQHASDARVRDAFDIIRSREVR